MDIIFDIDGTIADIEHRRVYVRSKPKNWRAFIKAIPKDGLIVPTATILVALADAGHNIILASGRSEESRRDTVDWLKKYGLHNKIQGLFMRKDKDYRSDDIVKREILDEIRAAGYDPQFVVDDRPQVVRMWRENGIFVLDVNQSGEEF